MDLRNSSDGLSLWVSQGLGQDPFSAQFLVFTHHRRDTLKVLHDAGNGVVRYSQRLERGYFRWPVISTDRTALVIDYRQFQWLLLGLSIEQRQALPPVSARVVG